MGILDYFKPVSSMTADEARKFMKERDIGDFNLIDVRQPREYERGHIPGAKLMPVGELHALLKELDPDKPTITYCGSGVRSRAAAAILAEQGFKEAVTMDGGMRAWEGLVSGGVPESGMAYFGDTTSMEELIGLSWVLEEGSRRFYVEVPGVVPDGEMKDLFARLTEAEEHHKQSLTDLYRKLAGRDPGDDFPQSVISGDMQEDVMEGGMKVREALAWCRGRSALEVLELAVSLETQAYDLYLRMYQRQSDRNAGNVFHLLATEEKGHLERLTALLERKLQAT